MDNEIGRIIELPVHPDPRGNLTVAEGQANIPFMLRRAYWVYDVPCKARRGGHAHKECEEFIIAASGAFQVTLSDGQRKQSYWLTNPSEGLYVPTGVWRTLEEFSSGAVCLVLASLPYDEDDYIYEYDDYLKYMGEKR